MDLGMKSFETAVEIGMLSRVKSWICFSLLFVLGLGCKEDEAQTAAVATENRAAPMLVSRSDIPRAEQGRPQPRLPTVKLWIGTNELTAEVAHTMPQIMTGMMWRTNMAETEGMIFVFARPHRAQFWMRNTLLPLSCAYIDPEGTILEVHDMKPRDETGIPAGSDQVQYVLEVNQGWFQRHNVAPGMLITSDRGSLAKTFFAR
jgi:uncharacterized protein